ncbi:formimidoylglutamase [Noviherbaspirillum sp. Root189]|uniref:formimidoylglutamase n=1 Tax=Noviherbaspirillum sp. Root189 TaxID=1736487 RepID=UPI00070A0C42|nr:formimidoylglutamase [Noviherbaspirillum sp. Root189]KRB84910.1 formimidoylglutamase [Noviherbaspirillum sp. Root189]
MMIHSPDMTRWQGRVDAEEGVGGRRWHQIVKPLSPLAGEGSNDGKGIALIGFACDAGVARNHGRTGAKEGPATLRRVLGNMPVRRCTAITDAGDISCTDDALESAQQELSDTVATVLDRGFLPLVMGGGHEIAYGSFGGLAQHLASRVQAPQAPQAPRIGVINLDAHFDLRMAERASSGTPFRQIAEDCERRGWPFHYCCLGISDFANTQALFDRARQLGVRWLRDEEMPPAQLPQVQAFVADFLKDVDHVYFTICLDVLPAAVAPGVSAPAARGVPLEVVEPVLDQIAASGKLRLADVAEFNPGYDIDQRTARVAARLLTRIAEHAGH